MAQNKRAAAQDTDDEEAPKSSKKKLVIGIIALLSLIIAGAASWYFTVGKNNTPHVEEVKIEPPKTPLFLALEPFTVNLQRDSSDQYLQLGLSLKYFDSENEGKIKQSLPEIRSKILQLLTTKTATELLTAEGKTKLSKEILTLTNSVIGINPAPAPAHPAPVIAASQVAATTDAHAAEAVAASAPVAATAPVAAPRPVAPKGVVDVLFTSFIIQ